MRHIATLMLAAAVVAAPAAAQAADLYVPAPPVVAAPMVSGLWEGPYVGVHVGYINAEADHVPGTPIGPGGLGNDISLSGWLLGAQVGANFYLSDAIVGGVVADISWSNASGDAVAPITQTIDWEGSLRAKLGFDGGNFMPYITGGLAVASGTRDATAEDSQTHVGWTVGAGVDIAVAESVSLNLEYRYSDYGDAVYSTGGTPPTIDLTSHAIRAGVNFHF